MSKHNQKIEEILRERCPHITEREVTEAIANLDELARYLLELLERKSESREPPHNLPTDSDSTL